MASDSNRAVVLDAFVALTVAVVIAVAVVSATIAVGGKVASRVAVTSFSWWSPATTPLNGVVLTAIPALLPRLSMSVAGSVLHGGG